MHPALLLALAVVSVNAAPSEAKARPVVGRETRHESAARAGASGPVFSPGLEDDSVALTVVRIDQGEGVAEVWSAVPLVPGMVRTQDVGRARLFIDGQPVAATIAPTTAVHQDGSLRSVVVKFSVELRSGDRLAATLRFGVADPKTVQQLTDEYPQVPQAVALPTNPDYLISTDLVGATIPVSESKRLGRGWGRYESDFVLWADKHWQTGGAKWSAGNYYDRAQIYYAWWVRTGNVEYWRRATLLARDYRTEYLEKNQFGSSHHWSQLEGVALHYVLTGDLRSREAVDQTARILASYFRRGQLGNQRHRDMESRIQARSLLGALLAWEVQNGEPKNEKTREWANNLPRMLDQILSVQAADGAFHWGGYCGASINYMSAMLNDVLIRYHTRFRPDSAIVLSVRRNADWLWSTQWRPDGSFNYQSVSCASNKSGPSKSTDLNMMFVTTYGWLYQRTGDMRYRGAADQIFAAGLQKPFLQGTKQFNQQYTTSYRYLAYRRGGVDQ